MPEYLYRDPEDPEKVVSVVQRMSEDHTYETNGKTWERVFTIPKANIDSKIDPNSRQEFVEKTSNKKGTMGDLWDRSAELSAMRADKNGGVDPVKEKHYKKYSEKRNGNKHPDQALKNSKHFDT